MQNRISLREAAEGSGMSLQYIGEIERGDKSISESSAMKLFSFYHLAFSFQEEEAVKYQKKLQDAITAFTYQNYGEMKTICEEAYNDSTNIDASFLFRMLLQEAKSLILDENFDCFPSFAKILEPYYQKIDGDLKTIFLFLKVVYMDHNNDQRVCTIMNEVINSGTHTYEPLLFSYYSSLLAKHNQIISSLRESDKAIYAAEKAAIFPVVLLMRMNQAILFVHLRQFDDAINEFNICSKYAVLNKQNDLIWKIDQNVGFTYLCAARFQDAQIYSLKKMKENPQDFVFYYINAISKLFLSNETSKSIKAQESEASILYNCLLQILRKNGSLTIINQMIKKYHYDYMFRTIILNYAMILAKKRNDFKLAFEYLSKLENSSGF
jgi:transcriptional regulator with XRE-family HTH domain